MSDKKRTLSLVIVGHVDHGKSTLIGRLLYDTGSVPEELIADVKAISEELGKEMEFAYFLDALEEEREQNITIDTTQTFFSSAVRDFIIIDAPGHKEFLRNMITGVSLADAAVLMLNVETGMEEQTRRHAYILSMLGIKDVVVAANKLDAVQFSEQAFEKAKNELLTFLHRLGIAPLHVIPISGRSGDNIASRSQNMPWYTGPCFLEVLEGFEDPPVLLDRPLRFPIQDCYEVSGRKLFVGRVESGWLNSNSELQVLPGGRSVAVGDIEVWHPDQSIRKDKAGAGESIGFRLNNSTGEDALVRGDVLCAEGAVETERVEATLFWMAEKPYELGEELVFQCATQEVNCEVEKIHIRMNSATLEVLEENAKVLGEAEVGTVLISTHSPVVVEDFGFIEELGRFVLVRGDEIVAGGIVHR